MKKIRIILTIIPIIFIVLSCKSNSIAVDISRKIKGNYYLDSRKALIEKIDTLKSFVLFEDIYVPNANYKGCIFQDSILQCISERSNNIIEDIDSELVLDRNVIELIRDNNIDSLKIIDNNILSHNSYSQLIQYNKGHINIYIFNSSLRE